MFTTFHARPTALSFGLDKALLELDKLDLLLGEGQQRPLLLNQRE